jgi:hypothetical protein
MSRKTSCGPGQVQRLVRLLLSFRVNSRPVLGGTVLGSTEAAGALVLYGFRAGDHSSTLAS